MKTYEVTVTLTIKADDEQDAQDEALAMCWELVEEHDNDETGEPWLAGYEVFTAKEAQ